MEREGIGAISRDRLEDGISALGPDERLGVGIVGLNESGDVGLEFLDAAMDTALDLLVGEQREPAFAATALLLSPGAQPNTIRARSANACAVLRRCM
jgi:hypothetical protein